MNPLSKQYVEDMISRQGSNQGKVIVTNNPAFDRFYQLENSHAKVKREFRDHLGIADDQQVITFIGFPERDYTEGYAAYVYESTATALQPIIQGKTFIYWPHGRGTDALPPELTHLSDNANIIFKQRGWWQEHNIGIHRQLVSADIALMTNSTASAEVFTAWGLQKTPMCLPIDITLLDDYPDLKINQTLRRYDLVRTISSRSELISQLPDVVSGNKSWEPHNPCGRLRELQWLDRPLNTVVQGILSLL